MGGATPRAGAPIAPAPIAPAAPPLLSLSVIPAPPPQRADAPIHPSPLPGGRLGRGCEATRRRTNRILPPITPAAPHHFCVPSPAGRRPNSSLPPLRGEVRWGVRRHAPAHQSHPAPIDYAAPPLLSPSIIPAPPPQRAGAPIHPSPLPGGRLGGGCDATHRRTNRARPDRLCRTSATLPLRHSCAPSPMERRPNSSLPPSRGEVRWGVRRHAPAHQSRWTPITPAAPASSHPLHHSCALPVIPAPSPPLLRPPRHSCAGRNDGSVNTP